jgi:predicted SAM-dependent methyltransferase
VGLQPNAQIRFDRDGLQSELHPQGPPVKAAVTRFLKKRDLIAPAMYLVRRRAAVQARLHFRRDAKLIRNYLREQPVRKLHVAVGHNILPGWLNSDLYSSPEVVFMDATRPFPFPDGVFDYVFNEHMIEHISFAKGVEFLRECRRVLRPGGKLRIVTPDLQFLVELYRPEKSALQEAYIRWATDRFGYTVPGYHDTFVINNFVRDWGHTFIYDEKVLRGAMEAAGFTAVTRCELTASAHPERRGLENESRMPEGFLRLESMVLEGTNPGPVEGEG